MMATQEVSSVTFKETHGISTPKVGNLNQNKDLSCPKKKYH